MCAGTKVVQVEKFRAKISDDNRIKAEWILNSTTESYRGLSFGKLSKIRDFAHCGFGLQEAFPGMLAKWRECGEPFFQAAQEEKFAAMQVAAWR